MVGDKGPPPPSTDQLRNDWIHTQNQTRKIRPSVLPLVWEDSLLCVEGKVQLTVAATACNIDLDPIGEMWGVGLSFSSDCITFNDLALGMMDSVHSFLSQDLNRGRGGGRLERGRGRNEE